MKFTRYLVLLLFFLTVLSSMGVAGFEYTFYPLDAHNAKALKGSKLRVDELGERFLFSGTSSLRSYKGMRGRGSFSSIYFPVGSMADIAGRLGFPDLTQGGWFAVFSTKAISPQTGKFRFVGLGDSTLVVRINGKPALDARSMFYAPERYRLDLSYLSDGAGVKNRSMRAGPWINLRKGERVDVEIFMGGEDDSGAFYLMIEEEGSGITGTLGSEYPLFSLEDEGFPLVPEAAAGGRNPPISSSFIFSSKGESGTTFDATKSPDGGDIIARTGRDEAQGGVGSMEEDKASWQGDFHLKKTYLGKAKGKLTLWMQPLGRRTQWEMEVASMPKTTTQTPSDNYFLHEGRKMLPKITVKRGWRGSKNTFLSHRFKEDRNDYEDGIVVAVVYEFDAFSSELVRGRGSNPVETLTPTERRDNLDLGYPFNLDAQEVRKWVADHDLVRKKGERDIAFANRVQVFMTSYFTYNADRGMSFEEAFRYRGIACGGAALLFSAIMRHNDIPARVRGGRWLQSQYKAEDGGYNLQVHVKSDFYAEGVGWVCVDFPYGEKDPKKITELFGKDGHFLTMQINPFVTQKDYFIMDQGFRPYANSIGQPAFYEWWEAEIEPAQK